MREPHQLWSFIDLFHQVRMFQFLSYPIPILVSWSLGNNHDIYVIHFRPLAPDRPHDHNLIAQIIELGNYPSSLSLSIFKPQDSASFLSHNGHSTSTAITLERPLAALTRHLLPHPSQTTTCS
jgi:hypothetical protein